VADPAPSGNYFAHATSIRRHPDCYLDAECRLVSGCGDACFCAARPTSAPVICNKNPCVRDPCVGSSASCQDGVCVLVSGDVF
jgi:hypothetical protein